ncbi:hypothetical protein [Streptomyces sp. ISL-11]|uniref:hypothetical protein n=1 Tax=Streptomyces sp. ISL-11 TaxID=2819174 RepID=UPI001BE6CCB9|nr:hypothetical protein [Streptomyces sp. ISL-11]MBT2385323.1 hypothetical protein [Streptomyces sp. ISL-11]
MDVRAVCGTAVTSTPPSWPPSGASLEALTATRSVDVEPFAVSVGSTFSKVRVCRSGDSVPTYVCVPEALDTVSW